jgi:hypothetical protein
MILRQLTDTSPESGDPEMQLALVAPPATTLPARPPITPAHDVVDRYGEQLRALGASVEVLDSRTVELVYTNNFAGVQAQGALKDSIDGVRLLVSNRSITADYWQATGDNVATWLEQSNVVERVERRETHPMQLAVYGAGARNEAALADLLRTTLDDGTALAVQRRMWAL